ncbi:MAG: hypothetical protein J6113_08780 [Lachnospiraceae bacterium]|nr:hypothetical protein [Lachnospiraceae bacterium]
MYDREEELKEIMRRSRNIKERRSRIRTAVFGAATAVACLVLLIIGVNGNTASGVWTNDNYGAFILNPQSGGYVLTAVIAFVLGASLITALVIYRRKKQNDEISKESGKKEQGISEARTEKGSEV